MMKKEVPNSTMKLGLKVVADSIYGFTGAEYRSMVYCHANQLRTGRGLILRAKSKIENHPVWGKIGCVLYGQEH